MPSRPLLLLCAHQVTSTQAFGLSQYGDSQHAGAADNSAAYAYVVGLRLD
ncbi:hypothetical protein [Enhygromyxa salina]|nr:hypothetical protein [Enhygromyxa salina]